MPLPTPSPSLTLRPRKVAGAFAIACGAAQAVEYGTVLSSTPVTAQVALPSSQCLEQPQRVAPRASGAGAIFGGLFLRRFITASPDWLHLDLYGWNPRERPGRPVGAEPHAVRALYGMLLERYG